MSLFRQFEREQRAGSDRGETDGATPVTVVPDPGPGLFQEVDVLRFLNLDTVAVDIYVRISDGGGDDIIDQHLALDPDGVAHSADHLHRLRVFENQSITVVLGGAVTTNEPRWTSSWITVPIAE